MGLIGHALPIAAYVVGSYWSGTDFALSPAERAQGPRVRFTRDTEEG